MQDVKGKQRLRMQPRSSAWTTAAHTPASDEGGGGGLQLPPVNPNSPVTADVFQLAPFKTPAKEDQKAGPSDVFLQAPFGKRRDPPWVTFSSETLTSKQSLLQQPVAVHRVVSRVGQQAAVGSVAVGPLHSWSVGGRAVDDPFTAAPFQPRPSQHKPSI